MQTPDQYHREVCREVGIRTQGDMPGQIYTDEELAKGTTPKECAQLWLEDWAAQETDRLR